MSLNSKRSCREGARRRGREDVDDRRECQIGWFVRRKEGWCVGVWAGETHRETHRDRQTDRENGLKCQVIPICSTVNAGLAHLTKRGKQNNKTIIL